MQIKVKTLTGAPAPAVPARGVGAGSAAVSTQTGPTHPLCGDGAFGRARRGREPARTLVSVQACGGTLRRARPSLSAADQPLPHRGMLCTSSSLGSISGVGSAPG